MSVFSVNQNRLLYVAKARIASTAALGKTPGNIKVGTSDGDVYFQYVGAGKDILRSDIIDPASVIYAKKTAYSAMTKKLKQVVLKLDSSVNSGNPVSGQDYIVRVNFRQAFGMSDEDLYQKYGAVHAVSGMTAAKFYQELAYSLVKNFSRLYAPLLDIEIAGKVIARATKNNGTIKFYDESGTEITASSATEIKIDEKSQVGEWQLGVKPLVPVYFEVIPTQIMVDGSEVIWGTVTENYTALTAVKNGYNIADLEYFCAGEKGDQYRGINWPNVIPTKYLVDPEKQYDVIDIHYAFAGAGENVQKSEKTITIVCEVTEETKDNNTTYTSAAADLISDLKTAGITVS